MLMSRKWDSLNKGRTEIIHFGGGWVIPTSVHWRGAARKIRAQRAEDEDGSR